MFIEDDYYGESVKNRYSLDEQLIFDLLDKCSNLKQPINILAVTAGDVIELEMSVLQASVGNQAFIAYQPKEGDRLINLRVGTKILAQFPQDLGAHQFPAELIMVSGSPPELMFMLMDYVI